METSRQPDVIRIMIIGPTGAGKTTTGAALARLLGWRFVDLDDLIAAQAGRPVTAVFAEEGESGWRARESVALASALREERVVIATGAGVVERQANLDLAREYGVWTIGLSASPETALRRIQAQAAAAGMTIGEARPMLAGPDPLERMKAMNARRAPLYALADDLLSADTHQAEQVAAQGLAGLLVAGCLPADGAETRICHIVAGSHYDAITGWGVLSGLGDRLTALGLPPRLTIVTDANVGAFYGRPLMRALHRDGFDPAIFTVPAGEESKSSSTLEVIYEALADRRAERGEAILALGGGVIGDLAGYAAATWLRGVPLVHIPTSLLAQVDASIGGKVAIDHPRGKNLIGAFYQPRLVLADTATLLTMPTRARTEGWAEVIKHGAALDATNFAMLEHNASDLLAYHPAELTAAIAGSVAIKGQIVAGDERESEGGKRALLNFGHTLGHAIETVTGYGAWLHGEAVSVGMVFAARLGVRLGVTPPAVAVRLEALLSRFGLPTQLDELSAPALLDAIHWDKKARGGRVRWILLTDLGAAELSSAANDDDVRAVLADLGTRDDDARPSEE